MLWGGYDSKASIIYIDSKASIHPLHFIAPRVGEHVLANPLSQLRRLARHLDAVLSTYFGFPVTVDFVTADFAKCLHPLGRSLPGGDRHWTLLRVVDFRVQVIAYVILSNALPVFDSHSHRQV